MTKQRGFEMATNPSTNRLSTANYELASIETRFAALFIDSIFVAVVGGLGVLAVQGPGAGGGFLLGLAYTWFFLTRNHGQTPGKSLMKIRVIKSDGSAISDSDAIVRYIGSIMNCFFLLGWLWTLVDPNQQGWHDKLASTYVVNVK
jgi:uncharacterized RDD family membrane protein YckC